MQSFAHQSISILFKGEKKWDDLDDDQKFEVIWHEVENSLFSSFRDDSYSYIDQLDTSDWKTISIARHHGLYTRLLDWSLNPLVGLFFAVLSDFESPAYLFGLTINPNDEPEEAGIILAGEDILKKFSPLEVDDLVMYVPKGYHPKIIAQSARFTVHPTPYNQLSTQNLMDNNRIQVSRYLIQAEQKKEFLETLSDMGIRFNTLFPDMDGVARDINYKMLDII